MRLVRGFFQTGKLHHVVFDVQLNRMARHLILSDPDWSEHYHHCSRPEAGQCGATSLQPMWWLLLGEEYEEGFCTGDNNEWVFQVVRKKSPLHDANTYVLRMRSAQPRFGYEKHDLTRRFSTQASFSELWFQHSRFEILPMPPERPNQ